MKSLVFTPRAAKELDAPVVGEAIVTALAAYAIDGRGDVKRLSGRDTYRLRVGRYRVIFTEDQITILAIYVGKRETSTYRRN